MAIKLMQLPYALDALEPAISAETLRFHHGKHHKGYVAKTKELVAGTDLLQTSRLKRSSPPPARARKPSCSTSRRK